MELLVLDITMRLKVRMNDQTAVPVQNTPVKGNCRCTIHCSRLWESSLAKGAAVHQMVQSIHNPWWQ
jgi:hypothetical protein